MNWTDTRMTAWAWAELLLYEARVALGGFGIIHRNLKNEGVWPAHARRTTESVCAAADLAACFYFKPVHCLQRSVVMVRMLRRNGIAATLVISYRLSPFFMHAFAEVDRRIVNDSAAYAEQLTVLYRQEPKLKGAQ